MRLRSLKSDAGALVLGLGVSGEAAARLLAAKGMAVTAVDQGDSPAISERIEALENLGIHCIGGVTRLPREAFDICVVSPGIDQASAWVREVEDRGIEVVSELELGFQHCTCPLVAVTGTNGKSTLVKLVHDILAVAGLRSAIAGNYGVPLCGIAEQSGAFDWGVVEVSSFQLERVRRFRPHVGFLLNLQPDHLDRHGDMTTYRALKSRLFARMDAGDTAIVHGVERDAVQALNSGGMQWVRFGTAPADTVRYVPGAVVTQGGSSTTASRISVSETHFDNPILGQTAAAAVAVAIACELAPSVVEKALRAFQPLSHRMETAHVVNGVTFIDDSKATNLAALKAGIAMATAPVRLIVGGQLKEKELAFVKEVLATRVLCVYGIGQDAKTLIDAWRDVVPCQCCNTLERAVRQAWADAAPGETILLSPGCASFDQFASYRDRGNQFKSIVEVIKKESRNEKVSYR